MKAINKDVFKALLEIKSMPILVDYIGEEILKKSIVIDATEDFNLLCEHFDGEKFCPPFWYENLTKMKRKVLVITNLANVDFDKQKQFIEILKYRKINAYELSDDCLIFVVCKKDEHHLLCEEVRSLLV